MASWPPTIIHPTTSIGPVSLIYFSSSDSSGPRRGQVSLLRVSRNPDELHGKRSLIHFFVHFLLRVCLPTASIRSARTARRSAPPAPQAAVSDGPGHQEPVVAGTGLHLSPAAVFSTPVSAPARLSRSRPSPPSAHRGAACHQPPGVNYQSLIFRGWRDPGAPSAAPRSSRTLLKRPGGFGKATPSRDPQAVQASGGPVDRPEHRALTADHADCSAQGHPRVSESQTGNSASSSGSSHRRSALAA